MRLFVAIYPPDDACDHLASAVADLQVGRAAAAGVNARLAERDNWHVTLAFLGEVPDERRSDVEEALARALELWRAGAAEPQLRMAGGGRFGRGRFTVLWIGLRGDVERLAALSGQIRGQLRRARLPYDERSFKPHLTLARPGDRVDVRADIAALHEYEGPLWRADELVLVRSHLGPKPTYDRLAAWSLPAEATPGHAVSPRPVGRGDSR